MLNKTFKDMMQVDISKYVSSRDGIDYLPWANCKLLLHEHGAEKVWFEPLIDPVTHSSVFMTDKEFKDKNGNINRCYEVAVKITIDDDEFVMRTPIMNGANPVKDNSLSQQRVWASQCRAFVKGVAMRTGLGFSLWLKDIEADYTEDLGRHNIYKVKERLQEEYSELMYKGLSLDQIADKLGMTTDEVKLYFTYFDMIDRFEQKLIAAAAA
jgi:hypothetical protein